ncbi:MAG: FtsQ-type POTRA domain-containing protein [Pseudomonadota bacterium]
MTSGLDGHARAHADRVDDAPVPGQTRPKRPPRRWRFFGRRDLILLLVLTIVSYVATGAHASRPFEPLERVLDRAVAGLGLVITRVEISGLRHANEARIYDLIDATGAETLLGLRPRALREAIVASRPWVHDVRIERAWPDRLRVVLTERKPFAVLHERRNDQPYAILVDPAGARLGPVPPDAPPPLPQLLGEGAERQAARIVSMVEAHPDLAAQALLYEYVNGRRWSIHLEGGRRVHLPWNGVSAALTRFAAVIDRADVVAARVVDLRRPGVISLHAGGSPSPRAGLVRATNRGVRG